MASDLEQRLAAVLMRWVILPERKGEVLVFATDLARFAAPLRQGWPASPRARALARPGIGEKAAQAKLNALRRVVEVLAQLDDLPKEVFDALADQGVMPCDLEPLLHQRPLLERIATAARYAKVPECAAEPGKPQNRPSITVVKIMFSAYERLTGEPVKNYGWDGPGPAVRQAFKLLGIPHEARNAVDTALTERDAQRAENIECRVPGANSGSGSGRASQSAWPTVSTSSGNASA